MSKFINLTPHEIVVLSEEPNKVCFSIPPNGTFLRVTEIRSNIGYFDDIPLNQISFGKVEELPEPQEDTYFIVSQITAQAIKFQYPERTDFIITDSAVRDNTGKIIGCRAFAKV